MAEPGYPSSVAVIIWHRVSVAACIVGGMGEGGDGCTNEYIPTSVGIGRECILNGSAAVTKRNANGLFALIWSSFACIVPLTDGNRKSIVDGGIYKG